MFSKESTLREIYESAHILPIQNCLISGGNFFGENGHLTLAQLQEKNLTWNTQDLLYGLRRLESSYEVHNVYSKDDARLSAVKLTWLPAKERKHTTYFVLMAGGAYGAVCTMVEALPVAAKLNELGYEILPYPASVQFSSVAQLGLTLCDPMDCHMPGLPVHHQLLELAQTHVY